MNKEKLITRVLRIIAFGSVIIIIGVICDSCRKPKIMKLEEIAKYRQELRGILSGEEDERQRLDKLEQLAKKVGAGFVSTKIAGTSTISKGTGTLTRTHINPISELELVLSINNALQTETMIDMCKTAARNFWIAMVAAIAAFLSALAALRSLRWCGDYIELDEV